MEVICVLFVGKLVRMHHHDREWLLEEAACPSFPEVASKAPFILNFDQHHHHHSQTPFNLDHSPQHPYQRHHQHLSDHFATPTQLIFKHFSIFENIC